MSKLAGRYNSKDILKNVFNKNLHSCKKILLRIIMGAGACESHL